MVYVDRLMDHGWKLRGHGVQNCHLFTDQVDLTELHQLADRIGLKREWFQDHPRAPHYDLTPYRRQCALGAGAYPVSRRRAVEIWRARRAAIGVTT